ncbi:MAG: MYG1 family protein [Verrucomicrobia bacterium]|nr:MYG1 family protein [Verrucomicrobiota bacterium]
MESSIAPRSFGTHDGSFHADEVTACSLLLLFRCIDRDKIFRTRDPAVLERCDYVCDVGGEYNADRRRFDHHQAEYKGTMSSAGMVLLYLKEQHFIDPHLYDHFNKGLVMGVDAHDNGVAKLEVGTTSFSQVVSNFLPIVYDSPAKEMNEAFFRAVDFVVGHLERMRERMKYTAACRNTVQEKMREGGYCMVFEESLPWMDNFFELGGEVHPAQFVIMPAGSHWKLRGIPPSSHERMQVRRPLPEHWAGLQEEELKKISGIPGAVFCHKGRFISIWETKEDALKALQIALKR